MKKRVMDLKAALTEDGGQRGVIQTEDQVITFTSEAFLEPKCLQFLLETVFV